ncbi:hypothetical protein CFC21_021519 [Triticum aestivum]|uniref:Disease resistance N-terminal domain-containing protein n=3 Tax=Triticum TaxID=4564 RepID=A0A9R1PF88_TRITD|nr:disease resistance protein RGA2-like [Triticum dicoccoides]XP_044321943.1 disease resistance protein RGA2-like [Triticum aestivum]KAF7006480.1 hypothetical protein CFC21_021519 [Triticum aestivum]VAH41705.1 unnamed protein product [Triticum turgidum subsp. durum]
MDILVSAIVGDLISRSASFVTSKYFQQQPDINKILQRLQSVLLRIDIIVEEAEARHVTNQGMLRQLKILRQGMYRGRYVLDSLRFQAALDEEEVSHSSSALCKTSPAKRLCFSRAGSSSSNREALLFGTNSNMREELQRMVNTLEDDMAGMKEFIFFLESYPRILRQPYGTYLVLDNCMFGRQTERERVLNFLLCPSATSDLAVLPIIGPRRVGKSTLVEYVCRHESVRDGFSMIMFFPEGSLKDEGVVDLKGNYINGLVRHQNSASQTRLLIIVEIAEDINEGTWRRLKSLATSMTPCGGSKIIITSRSDKIVNLGTTEALRMDYLPEEAYWHFFKSLAFGSTHPDEQPKLAVMAMEIALGFRGCFTGTHLIAGILRDNLNARFWRTTLECVRAYKQAHLLMFDQHSCLHFREDAPVYCWRLGGSSKYFLICKHHQLDSSEEVPKITVHDIILGRGGTLPQGEFEALAWRSRIPPYYNYTISCKMQSPQLTVGSKKRVHEEEKHFI